MLKKKGGLYGPAETHAVLTTGKVIRMMRELKGWTQAELSSRARISVSNISALEHDRVEIGRKRSIQLAEAFGIHPAIIMFPGYGSEAFQKVA